MENRIKPRWKLMKCKSILSYCQPLSAIRLPNYLPNEQEFGGLGIFLEEAWLVLWAFSFRAICKWTRVAGGSQQPCFGPCSFIKLTAGYWAPRNRLSGSLQTRSRQSIGRCWDTPEQHLEQRLLGLCGESHFLRLLNISKREAHWI